MYFPVCVGVRSAHTQPVGACANEGGYQVVTASSQPKVISGEG